MGIQGRILWPESLDLHLIFVESKQTLGQWADDVRAAKLVLEIRIAAKLTELCAIIAEEGKEPPDFG